MKLHHIGIATNNIEKLTKEYLKDGYKVIAEVYDPIQKANLRLMQKADHDNIELITTDDQTSRVYKISKDNYKKPYHKCYLVKNIEKAVKEQKDKGFIAITAVENAVLFNRRICFLYKKGEIIELLEEQWKNYSYIEIAP